LAPLKLRQLLLAQILNIKVDLARPLRTMMEIVIALIVHRLSNGVNT
jgi:hypothetical protein